MNVDSGAYHLGNSNSYDGVVHCRFFRFGEWVDVYTDYSLPYNVDVKRLYGGHSLDPNVIWVALIEKALAK